MSKLIKENGTGKSEMQGKYFVNHQIKAPKVFVIGSTGENFGLIPKQEAQEKAQLEGLDLVQVGVKEEVPVTKIMDFGKFLYAKKKQLADSKKHQKIVQLKEIKIRPNIGDSDYKTKLKKAVEFFEDGNKVKFTLQFKGREVTMLGPLGLKLFERITSNLQEQGVGTLVEEKDNRIGSTWSKIYFIKAK